MPLNVCSNYDRCHVQMLNATYRTLDSLLSSPSTLAIDIKTYQGYLQRFSGETDLLIPVLPAKVVHEDLT